MGGWRNGRTNEKNVKRDAGNPKVPNTQNEVLEEIHLPSAEPSVRETSDVEGKTGTDDQTCGLQHLRHT